MKISFLFLLLAIPGRLFSNSTFEQLRKLLTRNDTIEWLRSAELHGSTSSYCRLCCVNITTKTVGKHCGSHTLCRFGKNRIGPTCKGYVNVLFTAAEKLALLDGHNTLRKLVASGLEARGEPGPQPTAANMRQLHWDDELALIAERWAAQCTFAHDKCRDTGFGASNWNLARANLATNNELSLVDGWYDEVAAFDSNEVFGYKMPEEGAHHAGRYTQMIWADTYQIGCARAIFQQNEVDGIVYKEHLVCNYGPTGNIPNQPVYRVGMPCSSCQEGTGCSQDYDGLCELDINVDPAARKLKSSSSLLKCSAVVLLIIYLSCCAHQYIVLAQ